MSGVHSFRRTVAGTTFTAAAAVDACARCSEVQVPASLMIAFERAIAAELARRGPVTDETFRWIRKAAGVERGELAQILGVLPETIAGWEAERRPIDRAAWLLVAAIALDGVEGPRPVRARLRPHLSRPTAPPELALELSAGGTTARALSLLADATTLTERDLADSLDVDRAALGARLAELAELGLVRSAEPRGEAEGERRWSASARGRAAILSAAIAAGVDLDAPLPRAARGDGRQTDGRGRLTASGWRITSS